MSDNSIGNGDGADVIERVRAYVVDLGRRAVGLCELYDFGFPSSVVRDQIARLGRDFDSFRGAFEVPELTSGGRGSDDHGPIPRRHEPRKRGSSGGREGDP